MANIAKSKGRLLPTVVIDHLRETLDGFSLLPDHQQRAIVSLLISAHQPAQFRHSRDRSAIFLHYETRDELFGGRSEFYDILERFKLFRVDEDWVRPTRSGPGQTKMYYLTDTAQSLLNDCVALNLRGGAVVGDTGQIVRKPSQYAIVVKDSAGNTRRGRGNIPAVISVDRPALEALRIELQQLKAAYVAAISAWNSAPRVDGALQKKLDSFGNDEAALAWLNLALYQINTLLLKIDLDYLPASSLEAHYQEVASGRIFGSGLCLQNVVREVRQAALRGCYDYDISNAHPTIIVQLADRIGLAMPAMQRFLDNKKLIRETIARDVGITVAEAKQSLISICYGVRRSLYSESTIPELIGVERAKLLYQHPEWAGLVDEVRAVRDPIIRSMKRHMGRLVNPFGKSMVTGKGKARKIDSEFAHIVQGCEAWALNAIIDAYGFDSLLLLVHDGWIANRDIPLADQERVIFEATGFTVKIEGQRL